MNRLDKEDTIAAIATPAGIGAIGMIRVSGKNSINIINELFPGKDLNKEKSHTAHFGRIVENGKVLDEVLVTIFKSPHSYTGEDVVEVSCHGSPFILRTIMEVFFSKGIRHAEPGEFTLRAFLNGKIDLSQAEGVSDLISSESEYSRDAALSQLRGGFSDKLHRLREKLLHLSSMLELELDFSEEDVEFANRDDLKNLLVEIETTVSHLTDSYKLGNVIKNGVKVVIAGRPNAGKSTLLNALLNEEKALVSEIPGTTRDVIEDVIHIGGITFRFIDTAGIRTGGDSVEMMGIERTLDNVKKAGVVFYLFDVNNTTPDEVKGDIDSLDLKNHFFLVGNKIDLGIRSESIKKFDALGEVIYISGREKENLDELKTKLLEKSSIDPTLAEKGVVTSLRHYNALIRTLESIHSVQQGFEDNIPTDLLSIDLRRALEAMGEITGEITNDEVLGNIFGKFCIGK